MPDFETELRGRERELREVALHLERFIKTSLDADRVLYHAVSSRPKSPTSAARKQAKKSYPNPWEDMTDLIGVRVFTYFRGDRLEVEKVLRRCFVIDEANSPNKSEDLAYNEFGYTSRHLVMSAGSMTEDLSLRSALKNLRFEVQIRSVLEHGWAEVEHELVYKAGTVVPKLIRRRFAASAASLELIEQEFSQLREFETHLVADRVANIGAVSPDEKLDRAWFLAVLMTSFPDRQTWSPVPAKDNFFHGLELDLLSVLKAHGVSTVNDWLSAVGSHRVDQAVQAYALLKGIDYSDVNHLPIAIFACSIVTQETLGLSFIDEDLIAIARDL
jgi:ppGpp synthetase/RelA/SpoT-type nucleotidyltranferase